MSFMDKAKNAVEKSKNSDNKQAKSIKDRINEYTGSNNEEKKENEDKEKQTSLNFGYAFQYSESAPSNKHLHSVKLKGHFHICIRILSEFESLLK